MHLIRIVLIFAVIATKFGCCTPDLHEMFLNPGNLLEIWNWTLYGSRLFLKDS